MEWWLVMSMLSLVIDEIKCTYKMIILGTIISMLIMSVVVVFYNLTDLIIPEINKKYDSVYSEGVTALVQNLKLDDIDKLSKFGASEILLKCDESNQFINSTLKINDKVIEDIDKEYRWYTNEDFEEGLIPSTIDWEKFNYLEDAIMFCSKEDAFSFNIGDILSLYLQNGTFAGEYKIKIVEVSDDYEKPYIVLPAIAVIKNMDKAGIRISYKLTCNISKPSQYIEFKKNIESYGAYCSCDFDDMLNLISTLDFVFKILAVIFIVISVFVIVTISIINLNTREKFIVLQKVLGATDFKIMSIYVIILEMQIFISDLIGCALGIRFTQYLIDVVYNLFKTDYVFENINYIGMCGISFLISNIAAIPFVFVIKRVINRKEIISVINNKD